MAIGAQAIGHGAQGEFIGIGFTAMKSVFMLLDFIEKGDDSMFASFFKNYNMLPLIAVVIGASYALGLGIVNARIPVASEFFAEEVGTIEPIALTFLGLKGAGFIYEGVVHRKDEKSAVYNFMATSLNLIFNLVRAALSIITLIGVCFLYGLGYKKENAFDCVARPWLDLADTLKLGLVATAYEGLNIIKLTAGVFAKAVSFAVIEAFYNLFANIVNLFSEECSAEIVNAKFKVVGKIENALLDANNWHRKLGMKYARLRTRDESSWGKLRQTADRARLYDRAGSRFKLFSENFPALQADVGGVSQQVAPVPVG